MKLLMLISELGYGGAEGAFQRLARHLSAEADVAIAVFAERYDSDHYSAEGRDTDLPVHILDPEGRPGRMGRWSTRAQRLAAIRTNMAVDATISFLSGPNLLNVVSGGPGKRIVSIRGSRLYDAHAGAVSNRVQQWTSDRLVCRRADAIVPVSRGLAGEIERSQPGARGKVHPIVGYVDSARLIAQATMPVEPEFEALKGSPLIAAAGRLSTEKGFQHLLRVFAAVKRQRDDARLLLIGDGPLRVDLEAQARSLGLGVGKAPCTGVDVIMPGYRAMPHRYFRLASAFALTSASEGFPNILVEALASGVRIVAADVPWGTRELLGLEPDPAGDPYPTAKPTATRFGTLMPRISDVAFDDAWASALLDTFSATEQDAVGLAEAQPRVREFDCSLAAERWIGLVRQLTRSGTT